MIKQVKSIKVTWNDVTGCKPLFSFYKDENAAIAAVDEFCNSHGAETASKIWMTPVVKLLNVDCLSDMEFYRKHVGITCVDVTPAAKTPSRPLVRLSQPAKALETKKTHPRCSQSEFKFEADPARVAAGRLGGLASAASKKTFAGRARYGTVLFDKMDQETKRMYWRCMGLRKNQRKAGVQMTSWAEYKAKANG